MKLQFRHNAFMLIAVLVSVCSVGAVLLLFVTSERDTVEKRTSSLFPSAQAQGAPTPTEPNLKGAFIGDSGADGNAEAVLQMIKDEGAQFVVHSGDFDYNNNPASFEGMINRKLGDRFPYFYSPGNHDTSNWSGTGGYQDYGIQRMQRIGMTDPECVTNYGQKSTCVYKGLQILLSGVPYSQFGGDQVQFDYLNQQLSGSSNIWKLCSWHEQMKKLTPGSKSDSVPYSFYDLCREKGAFIVNGHAHVYGRTRTIDNFANLSIDPAWQEFDTLRIQSKTTSETGSTFLAESDFVKKRSQARCAGWPQADPAVRDTTGEGCHIWSSIYTTTQKSVSGALFITFNVNGDPNKAAGYFKNLNGEIIDEFTITNTGTGGAPNPNPSPTLTLSAAPASISTGGASTLTWTSSNATSCTASANPVSNEWTGSTATSGSQDVHPAATTTYTLNCTGAGGSAARSVTVSVTSGTPPTLSLSADPATISSGQSSQLSWASTNATSCTASGGWSGTKAVSGNETVSPQASIDYVLTCTGLGGSIQKTASVTVTVPGGGTTPTINPKLGPMKGGDNADDPAIWIHPSDPAKSMMFLSDKTGKIFAYNFQSTQCQTVSFGSSLNNIDARSQVDLGTGPIDVVAGNLRGAGKLAVLKINQSHTCTGSTATNNVVTVLSDQSGTANSISGDSYGFTLYRRPGDQALFAFDKSKSTAPITQWRVTLENGQIKTALVRQITDVAMAVAEGFVADDMKGEVYFAEEAKGIHKYNADYQSSNLNRLGFFGIESDITGDREGMALYACNDGSGYVLLSNQRTNTIPTRVMVYDRVTNQIVKRFETALAEGADGLDVTSSAAPGFPNGLVVMHDDAQMQYYVYDWADAAGTDLKICPNGGGDPPPPAQCADGVDNDVPPDSKIDFGAGPQNDPGCSSSTDNDETDPLPPPSVTVSLAVDKTQAQIGEELTYTVTYQNESTVTAENVVISGPVPPGTEYVDGSASGGGQFVTGSGVRFTIVILATGQSGTVTYRVRVLADPGPQNPTMTLAKQVSAVSARRGDQLTYTLSYANTSVVAATDVAISDTIPAGATYVTGSSSAGGTYFAAERLLRWTLPQVVGGQTGSVSFRVTIDRGTPSNGDPAVPAQLTQSPGVEGSVIQNGNPNFTFMIADPNQGQTIGYQIQIARDANFTQLAKDYTWSGSATNPNRTTFTVLAVDTLTAGPYWWRVRGRDDQDALSAWAYFGDPALQDVDFVVAAAPTCGNGTIDTGEQCDGADLGGKQCFMVGNYTGGTLTCTSSCTFDTTQCTRDLPPPPPGDVSGIWISQAEIAALPMSGAAWNAVKGMADSSCGAPNLSNQDDPANVCVLAKALVYARTQDQQYRTDVINALTAVRGSENGARALALGRELAAYVVAADVVGYRTPEFEQWVKGLLTFPTSGGPANLIECHEQRGNNWGAHCGDSRAAVASYLAHSDNTQMKQYGQQQLARAAQVSKGWLGDRSSYSGFTWGDLSWQCNPSQPVGINPKQCTRDGHSLDGVLPDDQRRTGGYTWPPPCGNYPHGALDGALATAEILRRAGYADVFDWSDKALLRAKQWLQGTNCPSSGDNVWQLPLWDARYGTNFWNGQATGAGKNLGWTDWTHAP